MTTKKTKKEKIKACKMCGPMVWKVGTVLFLVLFVISLATAGFSDWSGFEMDFGGGEATLDLFVMSQCPYGVQAEDTIIPAVKALGDDVDFNIYYIAQDAGNGVFQSLHGTPEVLGNIAQLCVREHAEDKFLDFILCQNKNYQAIPQNWKQCAGELGIEISAIEACYDGDEGKALLSESVAVSNEYGAQGSPTIYVNGEEYTGSRDGLAITSALCQGINSGACADLPDCQDSSHCVAEPNKVGVCTEGECSYIDPVPVKMYAINDKDCSDCNTGQILQYMNEWFKGLEVVELDVSDAQAKKMIADFKLTYAPAYIFEQSLTASHMWTTKQDIRSYFNKNGNYFMLSNAAVGASWFIDEEKKKEHFESLGVSLGDNKPQVNFFVMSYCSYGNQAEEGLYEAYKNLGDSVEWVPQYVYYPGYQGGGASYCLDEASQYCSMHGVQEANQNIRELCVLQENGIEEWFNFAIAMNTACDYKNADACWSNVATGLGLDVAAISACEKSDGIALAKFDLEASTKFGAQGSPAVYVDGAKFAGDRSGAGYQAAICAAFDDAPAGCDNVVAPAAPAANAAPAGGCGV